MDETCITLKLKIQSLSVLDFNLQVNTRNVQKCTTWPTGLQVYSIISAQHTANIFEVELLHQITWQSHFIQT